MKGVGHELMEMKVVVVGEELEKRGARKGQEVQQKMNNIRVAAGIFGLFAMLVIAFLLYTFVFAQG